MSNSEEQTQEQVGPVAGQLTGRSRGRLGWFGKVILQVEKWVYYPPFLFPHSVLAPGRSSHPIKYSTRWVDATPDDLIQGKIFRLDDD